MKVPSCQCSLKSIQLNFIILLNISLRTESIKSVPKEVIHELQTPNLCFSDFTINHFINLVKQTTRFDMIDVIYYHFPQLYPKCAIDKDDVQILYGETTIENQVGHFICIFYKAENQILYVYDSLCMFRLNARQIEIIDYRYPERKWVEFIKPNIQQYDTTSCGPFAIAYVTTLILGADPANYNFKMDYNGVDHSLYLRRHIQQMFEDFQLTAFPQNDSQKSDL